MERQREVKPHFYILNSGVLMLTFFHKHLAPKGRTTGRYSKSTVERIDPAMWNSKKKYPIDKAGRRNEYDKILSVMDTWSGYVKEIFDYYKENKIKVTKERIDSDIEKLKRKQSLSQKDDFTLLEFIKNWIDTPDQEYRKGNKPEPYSKRSLLSKSRAYELLKEYGKYHPLDFHTIDDETDKNLRDWFKKKYKINTIGKIIKELKFFLNLAKRKGYIVPDAYKYLHAISEPASEADHIAIPIEDILEIYRLNFSDVEHTIKGQDGSTLSKDKEVYRDWFVLGCFTGLRVGDLLSLDRTKNIVTLHGSKYIKNKNAKTGREVFIKFSPVVASIYEKYGGFPPKITEQKLNKHIKTIFKIAGFDYWKKVKSHCMRRSFCTNAYNEGDRPNVEKIMSISGHTTLKSFLIYVKVSDVEHAERLQEQSVFENVSPLQISKVG